MDMEFIMEEDNVSSNSENDDEMTLEGPENDSDTNLSYDDSSSINVTSIESILITSINEGDEEDYKENEDTTPLTNIYNPICNPSATPRSTRTHPDVDYRSMSGTRMYNKNRQIL